MSEKRTPCERLDMLLAGLEDEVLRSGQIGGCVSDEDVAAEGVKAMRCEIESLVMRERVVRLADGSRRVTTPLASREQSRG